MNRKDFLKSILVGAAIAPTVVEAAKAVKAAPDANKMLMLKTYPISTPIDSRIFRGVSFDERISFNLNDGIYKYVNDELVKIRDN